VDVTPRGRVLGGIGGAVRIAHRAGPGHLLASAAVALVEGALPVLLAWATKVLLDGVVGDVPSGIVTGLVVLAVATTAARLLPALEEFLGSELERRVAFAVQDELGRKTAGFRGIAVFEDPQFHDELRMAQQGGQTAPGQLVRLGTALLQQTVTLAGFLVALLVIGPLLAVLVAAAALPGLWAELALSRHRVSMLFSISPNERRRMFYALLQNDVRAAREIRVFGSGGLFHGRLLRELRTMHRAERAVDRRVLRTQLALAVLGGAAVAVAFAHTAARVLDGTLGVGDVAVVLAALAGVQTSAAGIVSGIADVSENLLLFDYYRRFLRREDDLPVAAAPRPVPPLRRGIEFRGVWFRYRDDLPWVLRGVDLTIPAGRATALVGSNGSGKTTLVKLLCRFYDPQRGQVLWDGVDLRELDLDQLRGRLSAVLQDFMEYELGAGENIGLGDVDRMDDRAAVAAAASLAGVHETVAALPDGYDTLLTRMFADLGDQDGGEPDDREGGSGPGTGVTLSGGQWQKISLARMFMRTDPDLVVLDEPNAALDADAEHAIIQRFRDTLRERTAVLISHRLNTVLLADQVVVLDGGRVTEAGGHDALLRHGGSYARMFRRQAGSYSAPAGGAPSDRGAPDPVRP
jgi:ATP-binding cassette, subfamily B, bacterial